MVPTGALHADRDGMILNQRRDRMISLATGRGAGAARMLLKRVDEPNAALQTITFRPSLIVRQSTSPVAQ